MKRNRVKMRALNSKGCGAGGRTACRRTLVAMSAAVALVFATSGQAVRYELKTGEQYTLCRDYVAALNAAKHKLPMACERHFPSQFKKFSKPKWTSLDPKTQPMALYRQMLFILSRSRASDDKWKKFKMNLLDPALKANQVELAKAEVDIDFNGTRDTVLRAQFSPCNGSLEAFEKGPALGPTGGPYYYVRDNESGRLLKSYERLNSGLGRDLFYYEGRAYLDEFSGVTIEQSKGSPWLKPNSPEGLLFVFEPKGDGAVGMIQVCTVNVFYEWSEPKKDEGGGADQ